jgi:hypothetical protein
MLSSLKALMPAQYSPIVKIVKQLLITMAIKPLTAGEAANRKELITAEKLPSDQCSGPLMLGVILLKSNIKTANNNEMAAIMYTNVFKSSGFIG